MKQRIENPRVFISYAWGTEEYNEKVILFATDLKRDGIDVVFDRWQLKEGNDTYAFMEKSVTDESITNVLVLLDPVYAKKADQAALEQKLRSFLLKYTIKYHKENFYLLFLNVMQMVMYVNRDIWLGFYILILQKKIVMKQNIKGLYVHCMELIH